MKIAYTVSPAMPKKFIKDSLTVLSGMPQYDLKSLADNDYFSGGTVAARILDIVEVLESLKWRDLTESIRHIFEALFRGDAAFSAFRNLSDYSLDVDKMLTLLSHATAQFNIDDLKDYRDVAGKEVSRFRIEYRDLQEGIAQLSKFSSYLKHLYKNAQNQGKPYDVEKQETMWHATTAYHVILRDGFKTRDELEQAAGLGGGVKGISFTASREIADAIAESLRDIIDFLNHAVTARDAAEWAASIGLSQGKVDEVTRGFTDLDVRDRYEIFQAIMMWAEHEGLRYNPLFFGADPVALSKIDPREIGIIEAVIDTETAHEYLPSMEEWRVPKSAILSYKGVS
jgi:hypothetical protein